MARSGSQNLFKLEGLEQRILLSADPLFGGAVIWASDELDLADADLEAVSQEEVFLSEEGSPPDLSSQEASSYNPSESLEDIFYGLTEEDVIDGEDGDSSSPASEDYPDLTSATTTVSNGEEPSSQSVSDHPFTPDEANALNDGLKALATVGSLVQDHGKFSSLLPLTDGASVGRLLGLYDILDTRLKKPVYDYFGDALDPPDFHTTDGLINALRAFDADDDIISFDGLTGGFYCDTNEIRFDVDYSATRRGYLSLDAGAMAGDLGLAFDSEAEAFFTASLTFDFVFGVDRDGQFFVAVDRLDAGVHVEGDNLKVGVEAPQSSDEAPESSLNVENGTVKLDVDLSVRFDEAIVGDGRITLPELQEITAETIDDFVSVVALRGTLLVELPLHDGLEGDPAASGSHTIYNIKDADVFDGVLPDLSVSVDISPIKSSVLDLFEELGEVGAGITDSETLNISMPVIDTSINGLLFENPDSGLGDLFDLHTPALEHFTVLDASHFNITDEVNQSHIRTLSGIKIPDFDLGIEG
ncbi:MAG: LEPR-XLL domain-containing protein, partial [Proteobacteria bacterium]|nr:LEPR-XLL domain-containing protein [Pseudomonadota bacterium]